MRRSAGERRGYPYLPHLAGPEVLVNAIRDGLALLTWPADSFAYAEGFDEAVGRYRGLRGGQHVGITADSQGLLVKADVRGVSSMRRYHPRLDRSRAGRYLDTVRHLSLLACRPRHPSGSGGFTAPSALTQPE
jgi:hypothetical protein